MNNILIVEDDITLREELSELLVNAGYETSIITDFSNSIQTVTNSAADLILLDINLPEINGEQLLKEIRRNSDTPVIMLTSRTSELDEVLSMSFGAATKTESVQQYHDVDVNIAKGIIARGSAEQVLTKNEMIIFQQLLDKQGMIVTRDVLMTALWDNDEYVNDNALSVNISRLRSKLAELGLENAIETRKKQGYILK